MKGDGIAAVIGGGGREHAIVKKLAEEEHFKEILCLPGGGYAAEIEKCKNIPIKADETDKIRDFAKEKKPYLTVVGPELPLVLGVTDMLMDMGLYVFGPSKRAAKIEGSKAFAKQLCVANGIPTAEFEIFYNHRLARMYVNEKWSKDHNMVVKGDGLAGGKAAIVCSKKGEALDAVDLLMVKREYGDAGEVIVIEKKLFGPELSEIGISDGVNYMGWATSQDHKALLDGDRGPNTGGMGAYSPAPVAMGHEESIRAIMENAIAGMKREDREYFGALYGGLMITDEGPKVLEFNCRLGDPETQPVFMRMQSGIAEYMVACIEDHLDEMEPIQWDPRPAVCIVITARSYPGSYKKDMLITGLEEIKNEFPEVYVFHAGTRFDGGKFYTAGGRVLGVTALGDDFKDAVNKAYEAAKIIRFDGSTKDLYYRTDIGYRALQL
jgi:phosphoribosylamine--glycine ligase